jgi:hypothetical protein
VAAYFVFIYTFICTTVYHKKQLQRIYSEEVFQEENVEIEKDMPGKRFYTRGV